jgi:hypothetical protein
MTTVLYNNWYDFYSYLFTTYTSESIAKTLIEDFIKKHNIQYGLNVLVDFLENNEGLSHDLIIKIITILRKSSIKLPFKLIVKYYDWDNLFHLLLFSIGIPIDFSNEDLFNENISNNNKYIYILDKFIEYKVLTNNYSEKTYLQNGYDILISIAIYTPMIIFDRNLFESICKYFIEKRVMVDLDSVFLGVKNDNNILVVENEYNTSFMVNGFISHLPSSNELFKTYLVRGILLDLITANEDIVNFKSSILDNYKYNINLLLNNVILGNVLNQIIINYLFTNDLKLIINFYAQQFGGWKNIQAEFWTGWLDINTTPYINSFEIFKYCSDYLKENFPNENDEMRQIDEIQDDYSISNYY